MLYYSSIMASVENGRGNIFVEQNSKYVQTMLYKKELKELKKKTRQSSIKDAISKAVYWYLKLPSEEIEAIGEFSKEQVAKDFYEKISKPGEKNKIVHAQSVLPKEDILALKIKTGQLSEKDALGTVVKSYLLNNLRESRMRTPR